MMAICIDSGFTLKLALIGGIGDKETTATRQMMSQI